ncbi:hypothetical protein HMPREF0083_03020 [Aneurinibacillus aneurinilyticus ATCC 12856]|uniref:Uncharacterized protein n=1 Tax=Aneurinibacillus aneurinilyticus ATCC 12856 TaxID=649747 RepID=U1Y9S6_ANEAE|nr:hypothetical protein HMPREF0083_03020 [Aneurinibacillus aneurinilyticus ATCC 12856]
MSLNKRKSTDETRCYHLLFSMLEGTILFCRYNMLLKVGNQF